MIGLGGRTGIFMAPRASKGQNVAKEAGGRAKIFWREPVAMQSRSCPNRFFMRREETLTPLRSMVCETLTSRTTWGFFAILTKPAKKLKILTMRVCAKEVHAPSLPLRNPWTPRWWGLLPTRRANGGRKGTSRRHYRQMRPKTDRGSLSLPARQWRHPTSPDGLWWRPSWRRRISSTKVDVVFPPIHCLQTSCEVDRTRRNFPVMWAKWGRKKILETLHVAVHVTKMAMRLQHEEDVS